MLLAQSKVTQFQNTPMTLKLGGQSVSFKPNNKLMVFDFDCFRFGNWFGGLFAPQQFANASQTFGYGNGEREIR